MIELVTTKPDSDYLEQNTIWIVRLNTNLIVYQYDVGDSSSWYNLYHYCKQNRTYITSMVVRFRSNQYEIPSNKDGYFFCKSVLGSPAMKRNAHFYLCGFLEKATLQVEKIQVPTLRKETVELRDPQTAGYCLIKRV